MPLSLNGLAKLLGVQVMSSSGIRFGLACLEGFWAAGALARRFGLSQGGAGGAFEGLYKDNGKKMEATIKLGFSIEDFEFRMQGFEAGPCNEMLQILSLKSWTRKIGAAGLSLNPAPQKHQTPTSYPQPSPYTLNPSIPNLKYTS